MQGISILFMNKITYNLETNELITIPLTEEEIAAQLAYIPQALPREIDARRLRLALIQLNLLDTVEGAITTLPRAAQIDWEYATHIKEDYPLVQSLSSSLGLNVTEIFDLAQSLT